MSGKLSKEKGQAEEIKTKHVLDFLVPQLEAHFGTKDWAAVSCSNAQPFFLGLNGIQGSGKTTLVRWLSDALQKPPYNFSTAVLSIDDLYLPHDEQRQLAQRNPKNTLVQHRGQPGTHDVELGVKLFASLRKGAKTAVPAYDKSAFHGEGDRVPKDQWETVNQNEGTVKVVIFEGWCVAFRPLQRAQVVEKWEEAVKLKEKGGYQGRLGFNELESVEFVNEKLREYDRLTNSLDALVHIDAEETLWVYDWRLQQETEMLEQKGSGMTKEQVKNFVDGYYPAYELFYEKLRSGIFEEPGRQLRLIVGKDRAVTNVVRL